MPSRAAAISADRRKIDGLHWPVKTRRPLAGNIQRLLQGQPRAAQCALIEEAPGERNALGSGAAVKIREAMRRGGCAIS